ncbi:hypothetical protein [Plasmodium yoelii yoelii]|uniref:Uncharacterized protein n=1 Tax=Plasmodium yoelii yoelii TaxID=73239 RepID=Q7RTI0_PLAYO|nr:hypothetical protein [Plasmodium yoelii yoelii]
MQKLFYLNWCEQRNKQKRYEKKKNFLKSQRKYSENTIRFGVKKQKYKTYTPFPYLQKSNNFINIPTNNSIKNGKKNFIKNYNKNSGNIIWATKKYDHNIINKIKKNISNNYNNMLTFLKNIFYNNFYLFNKKKQQQTVFKNRHINTFENNIKEKLQSHTNVTVVPNIFLPKNKQNYESSQSRATIIHNEPNQFLKNKLYSQSVNILLFFFLLFYLLIF